MKKLLMIAAFAALATAAMAMPPDLKPPITTGGTGNSSTTEVRVTANVVQGIAVNEASPIDFGNLARGMYSGLVSAMTPGRIHIKGSQGDTVNVKLDKEQTDLIWTSANGANPVGVDMGTRTVIDKVAISGLTTSNTEVPLGTSGEATRILSASFTAGAANDLNLGANQKLGSYVGTVIVQAEKKNP